MSSRTTVRPRPLTRTLVVALLAGALAFTGTTVTGTINAPEATAAKKVGSKGFVMAKPAAKKSFRFTNKKRKTSNIRKLKRKKHLNKVAKKQAKRMARQQRMFHNPNLSRDIKNWCAYGENVAYAGTVKRANRALWRSPGHRANMLSRNFNQMGTGVARDANGTRWVVQVFRKKC